jgi:DtxR family Mn-dependent transcriptional regulator
MNISESAQEQLELLWISAEENHARLPTGPGLNGEYAELIGLGLVELCGDELGLTPSGHHEARLAIRRHRLAERLLADVLVTEESILDERACKMEHALFDGIDESICTLLGHPQVCPHGKPIPPGRCCQQMRSSVNALIVPLNELKRGQSGRIAYLHLDDPQHLPKLMAMGILPGVAIKVKETYPSYVFEAGYSQFAVDEQIAGDIYVRLTA